MFVGIFFCSVVVFFFLWCCLFAFFFFKENIMGSENSKGHIPK